MSIINRVLMLFKRLFKKTENVQMIEEHVIVNKKEKMSDFKNSLKTNIADKNNVETLICDGDGLGIQKKLNY